MNRTRSLNVTPTKTIKLFDDNQINSIFIRTNNKSNTQNKTNNNTNTKDEHDNND